MSKKANNDEIDLIELFLVVWKRKWNVILIVFLTIALAYTAQSIKSPSKIIATTEIRPIAVYDEAKYKIYNLFVNTITPSYMKKKIDLEKSGQAAEVKQTGKKNQSIKIINVIQENLEITNVNKEFLFYLFIDSINEKSFLQKAVKESKLINRENYSNDLEYEMAVTDTSNSIQILNIQLQELEGNTTPVIIQFKSFDVGNWENFLKFVEKEINYQIQKKLSDMLLNYINYVKTIKQFKFEDIDAQLNLVNLTENERVNLEREKNTLISDRYIERMQDIFATSPLSNSESFYAAKIIYESTEYKASNEKVSDQMLIFLAAIFGAILSIFYVLIANAIQNRK